MGGFAAVIDWSRPVKRHQADEMLDLIPHRAAGGTAIAAYDDAVIAEARSEPGIDPLSIATLGRFSIVGDLRNWNRAGLHSRAGGSRVTRGMDDRTLILAAYARTGIGFLDDLDGDFAFVIWDDERHRVIAARDRFATKPLFYERTPNGIRFATEIKQLVATSSHSPTPNDAAIAEYLTDSYRDPHHTFFAGINKVRPASYVLAESGRTLEHRYWNPMYEPTDPEAGSETSERFRTTLTTSVGYRISSSSGAVAHLTGGLDSSSITAAAVLAAEQDRGLPSVRTASAVFPGHEVDESRWIHDTATTQPFPHDEFIPREETQEQFATVMWQADAPVHNRIRDLWPGTGRIARSAGADLVLMGSGGDEVLAQDRALADLIRGGHLSDWWREMRSEAKWRGTPIALLAEQSIRVAIPTSLKRALRWPVRRTVSPATSIARGGFLEGAIPPLFQLDTGLSDLPSLTQQVVVTSTRRPLRVLANEHQEAEFAYARVGVSYPYLDRSVVELLVSLLPSARLSDGRSKSIVRAAFARELPPSVLNRRAKTFADQYLSTVFDRLADDYRARYDRVSNAAARYIDTSTYDALLHRPDAGAIDRAERASLWNAWTLMLWLDGLDAYRR